MNWQQVHVTACFFFYQGNLRYSIKSDSQGHPNFFKNILLERYAFALLIYM